MFEFTVFKWKFMLNWKMVFKSKYFNRLGIYVPQLLSRTSPFSECSVFIISGLVNEKPASRTIYFINFSKELNCLLIWFRSCMLEGGGYLQMCVSRIITLHISLKFIPSRWNKSACLICCYCYVANNINRVLNSILCSCNCSEKAMSVHI